MATQTNELGQQVGAALPDWTPRASPQPVVLEGEWCRLEPLSLDHSDALYSAFHDDGDARRWTYVPHGPFADKDEYAAHVTHMVNRPESVTYAICVDGAAGGVASYLRIDPANGSIEVGEIMLGPQLARTTAATEAMYLMARHVFDDLGYRRYEWKCDSLNVASRHAALRLGFEYEGTWRKAVVYKGRNRDTAWFSMTDQDWSCVRPALDAWLAPENFHDGAQLTSLASHLKR